MSSGADFVSLFLGRGEQASIEKIVGKEMKRYFGTGDLSVYSQAAAGRAKKLRETNWIQREAEDMTIGTLVTAIEMRDAGQFKTKIIAASLRDGRLVRLSAMFGADILTMPPEIFWHILARGLNWLYDDGLNLTSAGTAQFLEDRKLLK